METEFVRWLREHVPGHPSLRLGLGDDAAIVTLAGRSDVVITTDMLTDGVDFQIGIDNPHRIGRQALGVNLSDMAAMAARPIAAVVAVALPRAQAGTDSSLQLAIALYEGLLPLAKQFDVALAGGDTNSHDGPLVISATVIGALTDRGPLTRSGGQPGDWLLVTGKLGGSILGHHFDFTPRVREAILLHERYELHAGMDLTDGISLDASRLAAESRCGAVVFTDCVPISPDAYELSRQDGAADIQDAALRHALSDGEDFELLLAAPPEVARKILRDQPVECGITHVGELIPESGLWQQKRGEERRPMQPIGWLH